MAANFHRSLGVDVSGPRSQRSCVATLDYFPENQRLVLTEVLQPESGKPDSDQAFLEHLQGKKTGAENFIGVSFNAPLSFPPLLREPREGLNYLESIALDEVRWFRENSKKLQVSSSAFIPYLHRAAEIWVRYQSDEKFTDIQSFSGNSASLAARMRYLLPFCPTPQFEVFSRGVAHRVGSSIKIPKRILQNLSDFESGLRSRESYLTALTQSFPQIFIYEKDLESLILNLSHFQAFLNALMTFLIHKKQSLPAPEDFPNSSTWIHIPTLHIQWDKVFKP